jgi:hypothetical protein
MSEVMSPIVVCALWEKDFHKGVGTLINSLVRVGYRGSVWVGYRGELPSWSIGGTTQSECYTIAAGSCVNVVFVKLETDIHFTQYKSVWMMRVMTVFAPYAKGIYYFDPDILVLASWSFFERWIQFGIAACEDGSYPFNPTHPLIREWQQYAAKLGYPLWNFPGASLNGGLVGVSRELLPFLDLWQKLLEGIHRDFSTGTHLKLQSRTEMFYATDQDALTLTACVSAYPISWVGPDGMAFERGEWLTIHAYSPKPWRRRVIRDLIVEGHVPDSALRLYWSLAGGPLEIESLARIKLHRWLIPVAALLGRFYRRGR